MNKTKKRTHHRKQERNNQIQKERKKDRKKQRKKKKGSKKTKGMKKSQKSICKFEMAGSRFVFTPIYPSQILLIIVIKCIETDTQNEN